jgi:hypothetical protein
MELRSTLRKDRWSLLSIGITVGGAIFIKATVSYLYSRGLWEANPRLQNVVKSSGDVVFILSVVTALIGLIKDKSLTYRIVAVLLSLLSVAFYVR